MKIVAKYITQVYSGGVYGLDGFSVEIDSGDFVTVLGESGCGKTTLLRVLAGLEKYRAGELYLDGVLSTDIPLKKRRTSMVFQEYVLYPKFTVWENIRTALERYGLDGDTENTRIKKVLRDFGLADVAGELPRYLSGGQQQRVALARAVVTEPELLLFDEPLSNVAESQRAEYIKLIRDLKRRLPNTTFVYVTHNVKEALTLGNKLLLMSDGKALQYGDTAFVSKNPYTLDALQILYEAYIAEGEITNGNVICGGEVISKLDVSDRKVSVATVPSGNIAYVFDENGRNINGVPEYITLHTRFDGKAIYETNGTKIFTPDDDFKYRYIGSENTAIAIPVSTVAIEKRAGLSALPESAAGEYYKICVDTNISHMHGELYFDSKKTICVNADGARTLAHYRVYESSCTGRVRNNKLILPSGSIPFCGRDGRVCVVVKRAARASFAAKGIKFSCMAEDDCGDYRLAYCRIKGFDNYVTVKLDRNAHAFSGKLKLVFDISDIEVRYLNGKRNNM